MSPSTYSRWGAPAALLAGALLAGTSAIFGPMLFFDSSPFSEIAATDKHFWSYLIRLVAAVPLLVALIGLSLRQGERFGRFGAFAFLVALAGTVASAGGNWMQTFISPVLATELPQLLDAEAPALILLGGIGSELLYMLGWLLYGIATFRARTFPRAAAILLCVGSLIVPVTGPLSGLVFGAGLLWLGVAALPGRAPAASDTAMAAG